MSGTEGGRKRFQKDREGGGEMDTQLPGGSGLLADIPELDDFGQVAHQNLSFPICAMGLIPMLYQLNE